MFGKIQNYQEKGKGLILNFNRQSVELEFITPTIINFFAPISSGKRSSHAVEGRKGEDNIPFQIKEDDGIIIENEYLKIMISDDFKVDIYDNEGRIICRDYRGRRAPFLRRGNSGKIEEEGHETIEDIQENKIEILKELTGDEYIYGLGEETGPLNKKFYRYKLWNTDDPRPHVENFESLYKSIPFIIILKNRIAYGLFFDNTYKSYFDLGKESSDYLYYGVDDGNLNYYFIYGPSIKEVIEKYTYLTGRTPLPPLWALGYHQSRYSYESEERVREIALNFRERDIPCDVLYLDIDYMDGYRVFTWDRNRFPAFRKMIRELGEQGFKVVTIIDPGIKKEKGYTVYEEGLDNNFFITDRDGIPYVNRVWAGESLYPDFSRKEVREWWGRQQEKILETGVAGIWNDMNEPASFDGPIPDDVQFGNDGFPTDHREMHNVYGLLMAKASAEGIKRYTGKRPFVITRACYAGAQKYSSVWTGDNQSFWEHLRLSLPMLMNLGLSGMAFCGTDVGGFGSDCTAELLSRWVQAGCFYPLFRNHSATYTRDQEPWAFDKKTEEIYRKYVKLRYRLLPYFYDLFWQGMRTGLPLIRPLVLHYQDDPATYELNDQFLLGENILAAPIVEQGQTARAVYLPEGQWVDYWTKEVIDGRQYIIREAPLELCPVFIRKGSIIPQYKEMSFINDNDREELILDLYPGSFSYTHYRDDGESFDYEKGIYNLYEFRVSLDHELEIKIEKLHKKYKDYNELIFRVNNYPVKEVYVDDKQYPFQEEEDCFSFSLNPDAENIRIIKGV
ncbi:MAG: DUF5110 domain-containing protein [Halanaerobiaceae bacterium]|nr:DUF5110 domain-containing protein [Halanaerobiaceae bacterium]